MPELPKETYHRGAYRSTLRALPTPEIGFATAQFHFFGASNGPRSTPDRIAACFIRAKQDDAAPNTPADL